jgi:hypothetical protein
LTALTAGLVIYYAVGIPSYNENLMEYQTYPWLASQIARMAPQPDPKSGASERITVFLAQNEISRNGADIYNGLRTRGIEKTIIEAYSPEAVSKMTTDQGFIIQEITSIEGQYLEFSPLHFNNKSFVIMPVQQ